MNRTLWLTVLSGFFVLSSSAAFGQIGGQGGGGTGGTAGGGAATGSRDTSAAGSTTGGPGGLTTEGPGAAGGGTAGQGGFAGANAAQAFVGASNTEGFVGGAREATTNSSVNRLFSAIQATDVPTGGTQESTGNPRRIPISLRLGFAAPPPQAAAALNGVGGVSFDRVLTARPELSSIRVVLQNSGVATLTGTAPDAETWRLAANLVRLQPGVRKIDNQVRLVISDSTPPVSRPGNPAP